MFCLYVNSSHRWWNRLSRLCTFCICSRIDSNIVPLEDCPVLSAYRDIDISVCKIQCSFLHTVCILTYHIFIFLVVVRHLAIILFNMSVILPLYAAAQHKLWLQIELIGCS